MIVEFYGYDGECSIAGYINLEDADDEKPLNFYDSQGFEISSGRYPSNPYDENKDKKWFSFKSLLEAMQTDDMLIQHLVDFAEESVCFQRNGYELRINESDSTKVTTSL